MELSKAGKKAARIIIDKGIQQEFRNALSAAELILAEWRGAGLADRDAYMKLYGHVKESDKQIAWRYDGMTGSRYLPLVAMQYADGLISDEDLNTLSEEVRNAIRFLSQR